MQGGGGGGGGGAAQQQKQQEERMKQMEDMKNGILSQVLTQEARFGHFYAFCFLASLLGCRNMY